MKLLNLNEGSFPIEMFLNLNYIDVPGWNFKGHSCVE